MPQVLAMAYDNPIPGYRTPTTSNLRLWDALPLDEFDLQAFNAGDYDLVGGGGGCLEASLEPCSQPASHRPEPDGESLRGSAASQAQPVRPGSQPELARTGE
jgi:hypothetical protein